MNDSGIEFRTSVSWQYGDSISVIISGRKLLLAEAYPFIFLIAFCLFCNLLTFSLLAGVILHISILRLMSAT